MALEGSSAIPFRRKKVLASGGGEGGQTQGFQGLLKFFPWVVLEDMLAL